MNFFARPVLVLVIATFCIRAPAQVTESWATEVRVGPVSSPIALLVQPGGQLHLFGGGQTDSLTAKLDLNGATLWSQRFDSNQSTLNSPVGQVVDRAGNVYVACNEERSIPQISQIALLKYGSDGTLLWMRFLPGTNVGSALANRIALDNQDRIIIAGYIYDAGGDSDFLTLKCDTNGTVLWSARYDGGWYESFSLPAVDASDNVYLAGTLSDQQSPSDIVLLKYDVNGQQLWVARYDNPAHGSDFPVAIHADSTGNVYVSGYAEANPLQPHLTRLEVVKFSATGQLLWSAYYSGAPSEIVQATASALDSSGNILVAGLAYSYADNSANMVLAKFGATGGRLWAARYNGPRNGAESARALALDSSGNAYVTGDSQEGTEPTNPDMTSYFTQKFDPSGNRLWSVSRLSDASFYNYPSGIGLDAAGGVYITGRFLNDTNIEESGWLAVKYVQTASPGLPSILEAPASQSVQPRTSVTFSVAATGDAPLSYQWRYNGRAISDATNATLTLNNVQFAEHGGYSVDVSNDMGVVATAEAELIVLVPPSITQQPSAQTSFVGTEATFTVAVEGLDPFTYQWRQNGSNLPGATNPTLVLVNVQPADAGAYSVVIGNIASNITSQTAVLTVSTQVMRSWSARYDPIGGYALSPLLALDGAGLPVFTVTSQGAAQDFDFATFKYDLGGMQLWAAGFNSASNYADYATALFIDVSGSVYVAGHSLGGEQVALSVVKYNAAGQLLWSMATNHPWRTEAPCVITADNAGNAYVAASDQFQHVITLKFDPAGQLLWATNFTHAEYDKQPRAIAVDPAGNVCLGIRQESFCCTDFLLVKYAPDGRELWRAAFDSDPDEADVADTLFGMGLDGAGNVYLAGQVFGHYVENGIELELGVVKFDGNGNLVWTARHRLHRPTAPVAFTVNSSGASWLAYAASPPQDEPQRSYYASNRFSAVVHFGPDGQERWMSLVTAGDGSALHALAADAAGNIYLTGSAFHEGTATDLTTSRIDPNGNLLWTALYNGPANSGDAGSAIAVGPTGDILVAGTSFNEVASGVVLLKYRENAVPGLPVIAMPPGNIAARVGASVTLRVTATGTAPLRYQWLFNGTPVPGGTSASLTLHGLRDEKAGFYAVEVSNSAGTVRSPAGRLEILPPPTIEQQPAGQESVVGGIAYFAVRASGVAPLTYQWLLNGVPIVGATNSTLLLENLQAAQAGQYSARISDAAGAIFSRPARLVVSLAATKCGRWDYATATSNSVLNTLIARDSAGNIYMAATALLPNEADFLVLKYSATGQLLWQASHDFASARDARDLLKALAVDATGNVILTGFSYLTEPDLDGDYATVKFGPEGNKLWARTYAGPADDDYPQGVATDQNGNIYVTGLSKRTDSFDYLTVKYGPDGTQLWAAEYDGFGQFDSAEAIAVDGAGDIYVTGQSYNILGEANIATIKYNSSGSQLWVARWERAPGGGSGLAFDSAGNLIVVGFSLRPSRSGIVTIKYDPNGNELWSADFDRQAGTVNSLRTTAVDAAGNIVVAGELDGDFVTLKYDANGHQLWTASWGGPLHSEDLVRDLALDAAGNVYLTGFSRNTGEDYSDLVTIKYSQDGTRLWLARESGANAGALGSSIVLDEVGNIYVVGAFPEGPAVIKYCQRDAPGTPVIHQSPQSLNAVVGTSVAFDVGASGAGPLAYQWHFNGQAIPGAISSRLLLSNVQLFDAGNYTVEVFNALGSAVSVDALLSVHVPATITSPPADECIIAGSTARFQVTAAGELPITYQWSFGDQEIPGATNDTLLVSNVQPSQVGTYTVRVSNPFGSATASASLLLQPNVQQLWARTFDNVNPPNIGGSDLNDEAAVSTVDDDGSVYVAGVTTIPLSNSGRDIFIVKYDTTGALQWVAHHSATNSSERRPVGIAVNAANEVHLAVEDHTSTNAPALLKYDANGQLLWTARFPGAGRPEARDLALDSSGNAYVIETLFRVMKVSPNGTRLWTMARQNAMALDVTVDGAGNVYVAGAAFAPHGPQPSDRGLDYLTVKYNAAGVEQWSRTFRGPYGLENSAYAIAVDQVGNVIVAGSYVVNPGNLSGLNSRLNFGTFKYDSNGNVLWFADYGDTNTADFPVALKLDAAGNVIIAGSSENFAGGGPRWVTLRYGADGILQWARGFGTSQFFIDPPVGLAVDAAGNAYVAGAIRSESYQPIITTVKYGPTGDELWFAPFHESTFFPALNYGTFATGVHADAAGRVLVTGSISYGQQTRDVVVLAYSQHTSPGAPVILSQPQEVSVGYGVAAQFSVTASNALRFQWQFNGADLPGANSSTLVIPAVSWTHEGLYRVRVENGTYCAISDAAQLTLDVPVPVITQPGFGLDGYFTGLVVVTPYRYYRVEASADLLNWTTVIQDFAYRRTFPFLDTASTWQPRRFYRVVEGFKSD